ncbi:MAG: LpxL/LpxP family Kdo(2)-lipid IV(A) lauroyl/palmitoleoyl acyltransferase [Thiotrichaceae bacterium]
MMQPTESYKLFAPRYWLWWLGMGILWVITRLPLPWQLSVGKFIGITGYYIATRRRHIATVNIQLCFPELSPIQQQNLVKQHFSSLGMGLLEMLNAWWSSDQRIVKFGQIEGMEHLQQALARGQGVILLSAHFASLEIATRFLIMQLPVHATYRPHENPVIEYWMQKSRSAHAEKAIPRESVREMVRSLRANKPLWFAPDQNFGHKSSVFAPFFNIPAATTTATARLARLSGAAVVPFFVKRVATGYQVILQPMLPNFPVEDEVANATVINQLIEQQVRCAPEQYLWTHRRFKDRPDGGESFYTRG